MIAASPPAFEVAHSLGLEARHITCRWREPPEHGEYSDSGLKGPTQAPVFRPFRPEILLTSRSGGLHHRHWICRSSGPDTRNFKTSSIGLNEKQAHFPVIKRAIISQQIVIGRDLWLQWRVHRVE